MVKLVIGTVATENGGDYLRKLCASWADRFPVWNDDAQGTIDLNGSQVTMTATPGMLRIAIESWDADLLPRLKQVVDDHLQDVSHHIGHLPVIWR